jgi:hypothetical protein
LSDFSAVKSKFYNATGPAPNDMQIPVEPQQSAQMHATLVIGIYVLTIHVIYNCGWVRLSPQNQRPSLFHPRAYTHTLARPLRRRRHQQTFSYFCPNLLAKCALMGGTQRRLPLTVTV